MPPAVKHYLHYRGRDRSLGLPGEAKWSDAGLTPGDSVWLDPARARYKLGRGSDVDVPLHSSGVARLHAILTLKDGALEVEDQGSPNGIWYRGERVQRCTVPCGESFAISGAFVFQFRCHRRQGDEGPPNLAVLQKSRKPQVGDIFAMLPPDGAFLFGRVISTTASFGGKPIATLIYIYQPRSRSADEIPELSPRQLLLPPILTNTLGWSRGYFQRVARRPLEAQDVLEQHCFQGGFGKQRGYFDERGRRLPGPVEPVGVTGLASYRSIDDAVSRALGLLLAPY